jgi:FlaA1/EpsC-like NDP-sugar epimerase/lipopolysaccharide/colanic/teichoic acid biosynthesis glycosyltransferase
MKRVLDVLVSAIGLIVLWPVLLLLAILIQLDSRGPVFFRQERVGRFMRHFTIFKLRTMVESAAERGPSLPMANDPRITKIGSFLRRTKLDEIPSLVNVLRGEMSLVGPRPELPEYVAHHRDGFREITMVRPGMTDVASLVYRDEDALLARSETPEDTYVHVILPEKIRLAKQYAREANLLVDLKLLAATAIYSLYPVRSLDAFFSVLSRYHGAVATILQALLTVVANALAYALRFDAYVPDTEVRVFALGLPLLLSIRLLWLHAFGLFRDIWRFSGIRDMQSVVAATTLGSISFWILTLLVPSLGSYSRAVLVLDGLLCATLLGGIRLVRRAHEEVRSNRLVRKKVLVVGSGRPVERVVRELVSSRLSESRVVGVVDGDDYNIGLRLHGVPILGTVEHLETTVREADPDEIVVACNGSPEHREEIVSRCRKLGRPLRIVPDLADILAGQTVSDAVRPVQAEDVLFREPIECDSTPLEIWCEGKTVMITGAGGSIGSEISRQIASLKPRKLVLFEKHENSLYEIDRQLRKEGYQDVIVPVIGDVTDVGRVAQVLERFSPDLVFHAAAYKHVPMMEHNPCEAFKTNVIGTRTVATEASRVGAQAFVLISTDKAVEPVSVMGTTKRLAELELQQLQRKTTTRLITVRFGNVLDSSGSVIPLFREQIRNGGPVTVTHHDMTRLFMTIPEAVQLILQAATLGQGGEVFVLDMGKPVRILDMAQSLIRLHGLRPGKDIEIVFTGLRPGEKLYEKLFNDHEEVLKTTHPRLLMAVSGWSASKRQEEMRSLASRLERTAAENIPAPDLAALQELLR